MSWTSLKRYGTVKFSDIVMSYSDDISIANLEEDVKMAQEVLKMYADAGKGRIRVVDLQQQSASRIEGWKEKYAKLGQLAQNHETCNATEFSNWMGVSRQAFYNWKDNGYIILRGKKVDMPGTYRFWSELNVLLQW